MTNSSDVRVALDLHLLGERETGNETYARELAIALVSRAAFDYRLLVSDRGHLPSPLAGHPGTVSIGRWPSIIRLGLQYPRLFKALGAGLAHMPTYVVPPILSCPSVVTVLDLSYLVYPKLVEPRIRLMLKALVSRSVSIASRIITISESSKRDIVRFYRINPNKVYVTPLAAGPAFRPVSDSELSRVRMHYGLDLRYVLSVGNLLPRKNIGRLIDAFVIATEGFDNIQLVVVGKSSWKGSIIERQVRSLGLSSRVKFLGYVPDEDLPALYSGALVFCFPSIYEGFGLPVLEAMACGAATVTSNSSSMPEVAGEAALTFSPESVEAMSRAIRRLLTEPELRRELVGKGLERAATFTWDQTARLTEEVYYSALNGSRS